LLQEDEKVSSDRQFRVRLKQPYNSEIAEGGITSSVSVDLSSMREGLLDSNESKGSCAGTKYTLDMFDDSCQVVTASSTEIDLTGLLSDCDDLDNENWVKIGGKKLKYVYKEVILMKNGVGAHI